MVICIKKKFICWVICISSKKIKRSKGIKDFLCERFFIVFNFLVLILEIF